MKAVNIEWDVDFEEEKENLPEEIEIPEDIAERNDDEEISDYITELTGFCHKGFEIA